MTSLKDYQVDRRKMEVWQHMQSKRTNRGIDFLRSLIRTVFWFPDGSVESEIAID
jgi:hypothetical protein